MCNDKTKNDILSLPIILAMIQPLCQPLNPALQLAVIFLMNSSSKQNRSLKSIAKMIDNNDVSNSESFV
jgi:hypothetical protein